MRVFHKGSIRAAAAVSSFCYRGAYTHSSSRSRSSTTTATPPAPPPPTENQQQTKKTVKDEWQDDAFAEQWTNVGAVQTNPDRERQIFLLGAVAKSIVEAVAASSAASSSSSNAQQQGYHPGCHVVLDFGCGSGLSTKGIMEALGVLPTSSTTGATQTEGGTRPSSPSSVRVVGVDNSAAMLKVGRERIVPQLPTQLLDIETMDDATIDRILNGLKQAQQQQQQQQQQYFSCVTFSQVLHELPDALKEKALRIVHRHLHPEGAVLVLDRYTYDPRSAFAPEYRGIWNFMLQQQKQVQAYERHNQHQHQHQQRSEEGRVESNKNTADENKNNLYYTWEAYNAKYMDVKLDHTMEMGAFQGLMQKVGFETDVIYKSFNRCLIAGRKK